MSYVPSDVPAVEVRDLRKEFRRRTRQGREPVQTPVQPPLRRCPRCGTSPSPMRRGECVAVLGQNGSGKSTLVRLLSTLLLHDGGSARVFGHDVFTEQRAVQRLVNRVSVEASFFKKMSAAENLGYASRFYGMTSAETRDEIPRILERVGFAPDRRYEPMENLSRGMQQKVALARALLTSPVLLLLDEPTTGPRPPLEAGGAGLHQRGARGARRHDPPLHPRPRGGGGTRLPHRRARRGELLGSNRSTTSSPLRAETLEEAFFAATGRSFEDEMSEEDEEREVFA